MAKAAPPAATTERRARRDAADQQLNTVADEVGVEKLATQDMRANMECVQGRER